MFDHGAAAAPSPAPRSRPAGSRGRTRGRTRRRAPSSRPSRSARAAPESAPAVRGRTSGPCRRAPPIPGMTLYVVPPTMRVTETTARCERIDVARHDVLQIGHHLRRDRDRSTVSCGIAACPPCPWITRSKRSGDAMSGPDLHADLAECHRQPEVRADHHVHAIHHARRRPALRAPPGCNSSACWKMKPHLAAQLARAMRPAPWPRLAAWRCGHRVRRRASRRATPTRTRARSSRESAARRCRHASPARARPACRRGARPRSSPWAARSRVRRSRRACRQRTRTVRVSWKESSGCW